MCDKLPDNLMQDFVFNIFLSPSEGDHRGCSIDEELLYLNSLREIFEECFQDSLKDAGLCSKIDHLLQLCSTDRSWNDMILYLRNKKDSYLVYAATRTISAIMCNFTRKHFEKRLTCLIKSIQEEKENTIQNNFFELLISLLRFYGGNTFKVHECQCEKKVIHSVSSPEDIFAMICTTLSSQWRSLIGQFLKTKTPNTYFLHVWKTLCENNLSSHQGCVFLNEDCAVDFLDISNNLSPLALKLYVDIMTQIFCSSLKSGSWKCTQQLLLEENILSAIRLSYLEKMPLEDTSSTFCRFTNRDQNRLSSKINITSKKIIFGILTLLSEFKTVDAICEVLVKIFEFLTKCDVTQGDKSTCCWIVEFFIECDDLLFGAMLTTLNIYYKLQDQKLKVQEYNSKIKSYTKVLEPHRTFIKFLQQIGWDYNELLSFLLSDETCCLSYLLRYLKLLLAEWTEFVTAHEVLNIPIQEQDLCLEQTDFSSSKATENFGIKLVSYSSSSSSEEELEQIDAADKHINLKKDLYVKAMKTVSVLISLREAIQKLIDVKEFPYNIEPLLKLLKKCSERHLILT